jgi:SnoaL-like domain
MEIWEIEVRELVRHTLSSYHFGGDRGRLDELASCFQEDGTLEITGREPWQGRDAIRDGLAGLLGGQADAREPATRLTHLHHHLATPHFHLVTPTEARTSSYFAAMTDIGLDHWGRYADILAPDGDRWLFRRRTVMVEGHTPASLFGR